MGAISRAPPAELGFGLENMRTHIFRSCRENTEKRRGGHAGYRTMKKGTLTPPTSLDLSHYFRSVPSELTNINILLTLRKVNSGSISLQFKTQCLRRRRHTCQISVVQISEVYL